MTSVDPCPATLLLHDAGVPPAHSSHRTVSITTTTTTKSNYGNGNLKFKSASREIHVSPSKWPSDMFSRSSGAVFFIFLSTEKNNIVYIDITNARL